MRTVGVICEYNPFHFGHLYQLTQIREKYPDAAVISLMSGSFVQRGEGAIYPKYLRAEAAVRCGADLVLSLPYPFCGARAELFARAGVSVLQSLGVSAICFGSEKCGGMLAEIVRRTESEEYQTALSAEYAKAKHENRPGVEVAQKTYETLYGDGFPTVPNDILGLEYYRAVLRSGTETGLCPLPRREGWSAGASRKAIREKNPEAVSALIPPEAAEMFAKQAPLDTDSLGKILLAILRTKTLGELCTVAEITPGIGERILKMSGEAASYEELAGMLVSRRESRAKIRRILLSSVNGVTEELLEAQPAFTAVLAAGAKGRETLRVLSRTSLIPILTKPADFRLLSPAARAQFLFENRAEALLCAAQGIPLSVLMRKTPFVQ